MLYHSDLLHNGSNNLESNREIILYILRCTPYYFCSYNINYLQNYIVIKYEFFVRNKRVIN